MGTRRAAPLDKRSWIAACAAMTVEVAISSRTSSTTPTPTPRAGGGQAAGGPLLSVIIPTYNERGNIQRLVEWVLDVLSFTPAEVLVVDNNSADGTGRVVAELAAAGSRVRLLARPGRLGLAGAVFAGAEAARGEFACTMDAGLSHDPEELPRMLAMAREGADVVIGSRYVPGSRFAGQPVGRRLVSALLNVATRLVLRLKPKDVLTGYVLCRRELLTSMPTHYSARGSKFLAELLATTPGLRVAEWPICFRERRHGRSKMDAREVREFLRLCAQLLWWRVRHRVGAKHPPAP